MIKTRYAIILLLTTIAGAGIASQTAASRTNANSDQTKNVKLVIEKAPVKCAVEAFRRGIAGDDLKTTIIYSGPGERSAIVKTVATKQEVVYTISGSSDNGWFEVSKIVSVEETDEVLFKGRGWIPASLLDMSVAGSDPKLRSAPSRGSRVVKRLIPDESEARPLACRGDWMKIKSGKLTGWLSPGGQCANPLTTCS